MSEKMVSPELFRPPVSFPEGSYDQLLRAVACRYPDHCAIIYHHLSFTYW
jgi:long-chain acyl-CoA synthetase